MFTLRAGSGLHTRTVGRKSGHRLQGQHYQVLGGGRSAQAPSSSPRDSQWSTSSKSNSLVSGHERSQSEHPEYLLTSLAVAPTALPKAYYLRAVEHCEVHGLLV